MVDDYDDDFPEEMLYEWKHKHEQKIASVFEVMVDVYDDDFPEEMLYEWKHKHEQKIASVFEEIQFQSSDEFTRFVKGKLVENNEIFRQFGPRSEATQNDPFSNMSEIWEIRKLDTLIPNNKAILTAIENHAHFLNESEWAEFSKFKAHAQAFEHHCYKRTDRYPQFPESFAAAFGINH